MWAIHQLHKNSEPEYFQFLLLMHKMEVKTFANIHKTSQLKVLNPGELMHSPIQHGGIL